MIPVTIMVAKTFLTPRQMLLLAVLTILWGLSWPAMKIGVRTLPPLWFRFLGGTGGVVATYLYTRAAGISLSVPRGGWPAIVVLAVPNMVLWNFLSIQGISQLPSSRAAILGYTMPVWAVLLGIAFFNEKPDGRTWLGVTAALSATVLLIGGEWNVMAGQPLGTLLMILAAISWGLGTHLMRRTRLAMRTLAIVFWMTVISTLALAAGSAVAEIHRWRPPAGVEWFAIGYNAVFAIALCNVLWFSLARDLPAVASGLSAMMVPVVGVFSSVLMLGESPTWRDQLALVLVLCALATVLLRRPQKPPLAVAAKMKSGMTQRQPDVR